MTVELDEDRAAVASRLLAPALNARVLQGDWHQLLQLAPFEMVFCDAAPLTGVEVMVATDHAVVLAAPR